MVYTPFSVEKPLAVVLINQSYFEWRKAGNAMKLIFVRHAEAVERTPDIPEEGRYLTPEGRTFFRKTARTMLDKGIKPDLILTSPLLRAVQTADILAETISYAGPLVATDELAPGFDMQALQKILETYPETRELVIVGHEPDLGDVIVSLLGLPGGFGFKKGTAVKMKINPADLSEPSAFKWMASGGKVMKSQKELGE
jgi:phosphohistidine phosphatase